jgi:hypothetical protein
MSPSTQAFHHSIQIFGAHPHDLSFRPRRTNPKRESTTLATFYQGQPIRFGSIPRMIALLPSFRPPTGFFYRQGRYNIFFPPRKQQARFLDTLLPDYLRVIIQAGFSGVSIRLIFVCLIIEKQTYESIGSDKEMLGTPSPQITWVSARFLTNKECSDRKVLPDLDWLVTTL